MGLEVGLLGIVLGLKADLVQGNAGIRQPVAADVGVESENAVVGGGEVAQLGFDGFFAENLACDETEDQPKNEKRDGQQQGFDARTGGFFHVGVVILQNNWHRWKLNQWWNEWQAEIEVVRMLDVAVFSVIMPLLSFAPIV